MIQKDLNLKSNALFGTKNYSYTETSSVSPSELMTGSDWLNQPNKSQKKYLDTEAVYRQFVYENYQTVDQKLEKTIAHLFDQDEFENTGIYSISQHIRDTLTKYMKYDEKTNTQSENVLEDFLNQKISGNDVLFASAAVEAFRHYNIPARYVEGYLLKSDAIDEEGNATLTSKDGHAWVEVYFENQWYELEGFILDQAYLKKLQNQFPNCKGAFCGYGVAVKDFKNPIIDFDRNNTYIQSEGINQDFGVYDSPDDLLKEHHQEMSAIKAFLYKHFGRHLMNRNVKKIRNC